MPEKHCRTFIENREQLQFVYISIRGVEWNNI